ncbi:MAG: acyloxyacyl hydrolase [Candidatus Omnitrophica bacterium]|nr:acyloxyacyl hydrolase [Candidatus Omnitrophota bacterium]MCM8827385.1 acyloxyacyl hydrolase [Candidatus Omnitrophota bacterium]
MERFKVILFIFLVFIILSTPKVMGQEKRALPLSKRYDTYTFTKNLNYEENIGFTQKNLKDLFPHLKEFGIIFGFARGDLINKEDYEIIPTILRLGFDFKPILEKFNFSPQGLSEFLFEPFINPIISPDSNVEVGCSFLGKYAHPIHRKVYLFFEGGVGLIYITQHTNEQSTQFNFIPQIGGGINYLFQNNLAFNVGYRYRHLSNASIRHPNKGINIDMLLIGLSLFF